MTTITQGIIVDKEATLETEEVETEQASWAQSKNTSNTNEMSPSWG